MGVNLRTMLALVLVGNYEGDDEMTHRTDSVINVRFGLALAVCVGLGGGTGLVRAQSEIAGKAIAMYVQPSGQESPPPVYDEKADAREDIANALKKAKKENRRVLIQWGANWCGWCNLLDGTFKSDPDVRRKLMYEYDVVHVDIGKWDKNLDLVEKYEADIQNNGVPFLTILDAEDNVLVNHETGSLEKEIDGKPGHDPEKIVTLLTEHQAPYHLASELLANALETAREEDKRVFLHFGAPWCGWCHRLEDWMALEEVEETLSKEFIDLKIDVDRTIGGKELDAETRKTSGGGGIPWFVFLDAEGEQLITSDGPGGNVGFPVTDEEVAHFMDMLKSKTKNLNADDIAFLEQSLRRAAPKRASDH